MNKILKLGLISITSCIMINNAYADPVCYMQMRSLNLSIAEENKGVCEQKELVVEPESLSAQETEKKTEESAIEMDAYFVYPRIENGEEEATADGIGANFSIGF